MEGLFAVVIIGIDDHKGLPDQFPAAEYRLTGSPRLGPCFSFFKTIRQIRQLLIGISHRTDLFNPVADDFFKILFQILPDDEYHLIESGFQGIMNRIVHDDFSRWAHSFQLLDSASISAADSSGHDDQCCVHDR